MDGEHNTCEDSLPEVFNHVFNPVSGVGLEKTELERLQIVDAIKGYKSKSVGYK